MDEELYELMRTGWKTPYADPTKPADPLAMQAPNVYPGEKISSFGPVVAVPVDVPPAVPPDPPVDPPEPIDACAIGGPTADTEGEDGDTTVTAPGCELRAPIPPDCTSGFRCVIIFESQVDECEPEWFGCPRTLGVFCINPEGMGMPLREWFIVEDPSWLTGSTEPVAWYLIEMPMLPGLSRVCSPATTNQPPGNNITGMPEGNYAPCSLQDLVDLLALCESANEDGVVTTPEGFTIQLPAGFCDDVQTVANQVENPGKFLGRPNDPNGPMHTPATIGICVSLWQIDWDNCQTTRLANGEVCKGAWGPPKLKSVTCMSTLTWAILKAFLGASLTEGFVVPGHEDDPESDCHRQFYMTHGKCRLVTGKCTISWHIRPWKNPDGSDKCVCPSPGGGWHECPCSTPGAVPGGYDPCDPANGYVPPSTTENCDGGGISLTDPAGGTGGNVEGGNTTQPNNGKDPKEITPTVVVPRDYGRMPKPPSTCAQLVCSYQCTTCYGAFLNGLDNPAMPQGFWGVALAFHACEANLCEETEVKQRKSCKVSGPCSNGQQKSWRTKSCAVGDRENQRAYCWDPFSTFPGTTTPNFYSSCPVCRGFAQSSYVCRGTPKRLTRGPWTATYTCKTLAEWKTFFEEILCNAWRTKVWDSCLGVCSSFYCGGTLVNQEGVTQSGDCPPNGLQVPRSGDDPTEVTIGYTATHSPCGDSPGSIVTRAKTWNGQWGNTHIPITTECQGAGCVLPEGVTLNCAVGTTYTNTTVAVYTTSYPPLDYQSRPSQSPCRNGCTCRWRPTSQVVPISCAPPGTTATFGFWGMWHATCSNLNGSTYSCCVGYSYWVIANQAKCSTLEISVICPDGRKMNSSTHTMCDCNPGQRRVTKITSNYVRNDCKTPPSIP